jgi:hypothetical protein
MSRSAHPHRDCFRLWSPSRLCRRRIADGNGPINPARKLALEATTLSPTQAGFMLLKFAESLHAVQDSWSHQGISDMPRPLEGAVSCDPTLAWAHPAPRGGWNSHKADLTYEWPVDTVAMAKAMYDLLLQFLQLPTPSVHESPP